MILSLNFKMPIYLALNGKKNLKCREKQENENKKSRKPSKKPRKYKRNTNKKKKKFFVRFF